MPAAIEKISTQPERSESLYEITDHLQALFDTFDLTEEGTHEREQIDQEIERTVAGRMRKGDSITEWFRRQDHENLFDRCEIERRQDAIDRREKAKARMKNYLRRILYRTGERKIQGRTSLISLRAGSESLNVTDAAAIPAEYRIVQQIVQIDRARIKQALKRGEVVPGAALKRGEESVVIA